MVDKTTKIVVTGDTSKYERSMQSAQTAHNKTIGTIKTGWLQITAAIYGAAKAYDALKMGARAQQEALAFANMAASYGASADKIVADLKRASAGTVDTMTLIQKAGTAMMMGIQPEKLSKLMDIARATSKMTGQTVTKAFEDISLAVGRQSRMILDNLGIIVKMGEANKIYAAELGKTVLQLTDVEKKQAFLNATLKAGEELITRMGTQVKSTAEMFQSLEAFAKNTWVAISQGAIWVIKNITIAYTLAGKTINLVLQRTADAILWFVEMWNKFPMAAFQIPVEPLRAMVDQLRMAVEESNKFAAALIDLDKAGITAKPLRPGGGDITTADKAKNEFLEASLSQAKAYDEALLAEREAYAERDLEIIREKLEQDKALKAELWEWEIDQANRLDEAIIKGHINTTDQIVGLKDLEKAAAKDAAMQMLSDYAYAFQHFGKQSKEAFVAFKAFAIAQATIKTYESAVSAYSAMASIPYVGPALGAIAAAGAIAAGLANVHAIMSTEPGSSPGGAVGTYSASPATGLPISTAPASAESKPALTIIIEGDFIGDESYIDNLVERINGAEDRDVFIRRTLYAREVE